MAGLVTATAVAAPHVYPHIELAPWLYPVVGVDVSNHQGRRPLVYTTWEFDSATLAGSLAGERFWLRSLIVPPLFRRDQWVVWQYHNRGRRPGVRGDLDLNVFRGTQAEFDAFARGGQPALTPP